MRVYLITNLIDGKYYVGKTSRTLAQRWSSHKHEALKGAKGASRLHRAMYETGVENFSIIELSEAKTTVFLDGLERLWIVILRSYDSDIGYNQKMGGGGRRSGNWLEMYRGAHLRRRSEVMKARWQTPEFQKRMTGESNPNFGKGLFGADNPMFGKSRPDLANWNRRRRKRA